MRPDLEEKLVNDFPKIYSKGFLFECDDGWFDLIYDLSSKLNKLEINELEITPYAHQVKEKFGSLRFYTMLLDSSLANELITQAELLSEKTCEICGSPGELSGKAWFKTLCDKHKKEFNE